MATWINLIMTKTSEPIVFFGSGPVAAESLRLLAKNFEVEFVVTKPRPAHHHGDVPVLAAAEGLGMPVKTAGDKHQLDELFESQDFTSRVGVLIDFGIIVTSKVINSFPLGIVNSHFSVLPEWRGADPITFSILSGQEQTGVSLMLLVEAMDEGPLIGFGEYELYPEITTPELTKNLIQLSDELLAENLPRYISGEAQAAPQDITGREVSYSRKLTKEDGILDWHKPAYHLEREIRAFIEWPKSRAKFGELEVVITQAKTNDAPGTEGSRHIVNKLPAVHCGEGTLIIERLKPAGKKEMTGEAFLAGYKKQFLA